MKKRGKNNIRFHDLVISLLALIIFTGLFFLVGKYFFPEFFSTGSTGFFVYTIQPPDFEEQESYTTATSINQCGYNITSSGNYNLSSDLLNCPDYGIKINVSNVVLDCLGHKISSANGLENGIDTENSLTNITITNCTIESFSSGIKFANIQNGTIEYCTFINNSNDGIYFFNVSNIDVFSNRFVNSTVGIEGDAKESKIHQNNFSKIVESIHLFSSFFTTSANNTISDNEFMLHLLGGQDTYGIKIEDSYNDIIENNTFDTFPNESYAIYVSASEPLGTIIRNNIFTNTDTNILIYSSSTNSTVLVTSNTHNNCNIGINITNTHKNRIINDSLNCKNINIFIENTQLENNITGAIISGGDFGIHLENAGHVNIKSSEIKNTFAGLFIKNNCPYVYVSDSNFTSNYFGFIVYNNTNIAVFRLDRFNSNANGGSMLRSTNLTFINVTANSNLNNGLIVDLYSNNINISYSNISNNQGHGVRLNFFTHHNTISNNTITNNAGYGIYMDFYATNNTIQYNDLSGNTQGTYYEGDFCTDNTFTGNTP